MPPTSKAQQRYIFEEARKGVPWAVKFVEDSPTMRVQLKGHKMPKPEHRYLAAKRKLIEEGKNAVSHRA